MTKALTTVDLLAARKEANRPAMNPASIIWPEWPRDDVPVVAMVPRSKRHRDDKPVTILNKNWKSTI